MSLSKKAVRGVHFHGTTDEATGRIRVVGSSETPKLAPLLAEYDENGNLVAKYHHDGGGLLAMIRNNSSLFL